MLCLGGCLFVAMQQIASVVYTKEQRPVPEDYRVPDYMEKIYTWCYVKPKNVKMLDRQLVGIDEEAENAHILEAAKKLWGSLNNRVY